MENPFKKLVLVNPEVASAIYKPTTTEKKLGTLDQAIRDILNSSLPDDEKAKQYVTTLKTHKLLSSSKTRPVDAESEILDSIDPPQEKARAKELLRLIKPYLL